MSGNEQQYVSLPMPLAVLFMSMTKFEILASDKGSITIKFNYPEGVNNLQTPQSTFNLPAIENHITAGHNGVHHAPAVQAQTAPILGADQGTEPQQALFLRSDSPEPPLLPEFTLKPVQQSTGTYAQHNASPNSVNNIVIKQEEHREPLTPHFAPTTPNSPGRSTSVHFHALRGLLANKRATPSAFDEDDRTGQADVASNGRPSPALSDRPVAEPPASPVVPDSEEEGELVSGPQDMEDGEVERTAEALLGSPAHGRLSLPPIAVKPSPPPSPILGAANDEALVLASPDLAAGLLVSAPDATDSEDDLYVPSRMPSRVSGGGTNSVRRGSGMRVHSPEPGPSRRRTSGASTIPTPDSSPAIAAATASHVPTSPAQPPNDGAPVGAASSSNHAAPSDVHQMLSGALSAGSDSPRQQPPSSAAPKPSNLALIASLEILKGRKPLLREAVSPPPLMSMNHNSPPRAPRRLPDNYVVKPPPSTLFSSTSSTSKSYAALPTPTSPSQPPRAVRPQLTAQPLSRIPPRSTPTHVNASARTNASTKAAGKRKANDFAAFVRVTRPKISGRENEPGPSGPSSPAAHRRPSAGAQLGAMGSGSTRHPGRGGRWAKERFPEAFVVRPARLEASEKDVSHTQAQETVDRILPLIVPNPSAKTVEELREALDNVESWTGRWAVRILQACSFDPVKGVLANPAISDDLKKQAQSILDTRDRRLT